MNRVSALAFALTALAIYLGAFHVGPLHTADAAVLWLFTRFDDTPVEFFAETIVLLIHPVVYALLCGGLLLWAWRNRGLREAARAAVLILGANATTQLLKEGVAEPRFHEMLDRQIDAASWPSGHATAAASLALAAYLLAPRTKPYGIALAVAMGVAVVVNSWHYPSDALGAYAVATTWGAALVSLRRPAATAAPRRRSSPATG